MPLVRAARRRSVRGPRTCSTEPPGRTCQHSAALAAHNALAGLPAVVAEGDVALEAVLDAVLALATAAGAVHGALVARHQVALAMHVAVSTRTVAAEGAGAGVLPLPEADVAGGG